MPDASETPPITTYKRRWLILFIFMVYSMTNSWQWIQFAIISNITAKYYNVPTLYVDWTSIIFFLAYVPTILPASVFMDKKGLRWSIFLGSLGTTAGAWIKAASVDRNMFWIAYVGQTVTALAQTFMLAVPPQVASTWFPSHQVATACALGVFGNQVGIASGFVFTPMIVRNHDNVDDIGADLRFMQYFMAAMCTAVLILVIVFFQDKPPEPPSVEMMNRQKLPIEFWEPLKRLLRNRPFVLLMFSYGISVGVFNALSTLLNRLILIYFEHGEEFGGRIGMLLVFGGLVGGVICGILLDKTHKYREIAVGLYVLTLLSIVGFYLTLRSQLEVPVYAVSLVLGLTLNGYVSVGYEFVSELTYPESENLSAGLLMCLTQTISMVLSMSYGPLIDVVGDMWASVFMSAMVLVGCVFTALVPPHLKRLASQQTQNIHYPPHSTSVL